MDDIINYVMNTPANTNPNVLKGLLDKEGSSGGASEPLVLTAIPSEQSMFSGTVSGATKEEILDAWNSGRLIYLTIGDFSIHLMCYNAVLELPVMSANFRLTYDAHPRLAVGSLWLNQMSYSVDLYPLNLS